MAYLLQEHLKVMAEADQRPSSLTSTQEVEEGSMTTSHLPANQIMIQMDSTSEGDAGEGRVREKLKQTSIDSNVVDTMKVIHQVLDSTASNLESSIRDNSREAANDDAGDKGPRPLRKRSLEDLDTTEVSQAPFDEMTTSPTGHARKRSKDVRNGDLTRPVERRHTPTALMEEDEDPAPLESSEPSTRATESIEVDEVESSAEARIKETTSPRRKRSREEFDVELDREQKIPATDISRARRRSSEEERRDDSQPAAIAFHDAMAVNNALAANEDHEQMELAKEPLVEKPSTAQVESLSSLDQLRILDANQWICQYFL